MKLLGFACRKTCCKSAIFGDLSTINHKNQLTKQHAQETPRNLPKVLELNDSALEFGKACGNLTWIHCISNTQIRDKWEFRKSIEQSRKEGTSAVLLQSDLNEKWWADCETFKIF